MSSYTNVVKGKLSFKGEGKKTGLSTSKILGKRKTDKSMDESAHTQPNNTTMISSQNHEEVQLQNGIGRITSSGTTVQGHYTEFMKQLSVGDAIIITHPTSLQEETKVVRMVLSNVSIGISSAFSTDLISTTPFRFIKAPKDEENEDEKERQAVFKRNKAEEAAFGTYASQGGSKFTYRVKKESAFGGYKIVTESTDGALSREELLDKRTKKKSDRINRQQQQEPLNRVLTVTTITNQAGVYRPTQDERP